MSHLSPWKLSTLVLGGLLAAAVPYVSLPLASAEPQPAMRNALASLQAAKDSLQNASHDKGGHRAAALKLTEQAIDETKRGIEHDNQR
jgi:hypothetical protein